MMRILRMIICSEYDDASGVRTYMLILLYSDNIEVAKMVFDGTFGQLRHSLDFYNRKVKTQRGEKMMMDISRMIKRINKC